MQPNTLPNLGTCRFCGAGLRHTFVDLGMSPPCEAILERAQLNQMEAFYPLHVFVCDQCFLVQLQEYVTPKDIFTEYTLLLFLLRQLVGAREGVHEADD